MEVANGIEMLEIEATILGKSTSIYPTLIYDGSISILVDTGFPGQASLIRDSMKKAGRSFEELRKIVITHHDIDHIGSLPAILSESPKPIQVLAHEIEKPFVQGEKILLKYTSDAIEGALHSLPPEFAATARKSIQMVLDNPPKAGVDKTVIDGQELPYCGGIIVIDTPGHTPGHISLYHKQSKTLVAADAMRIEQGKLLGPDPSATLDMDTAIRSLDKLKQYDIQSIICYHGGLCRDSVNERIAALCQ